MKKILSILFIFLIPNLIFGATTTTFLEAGTDATQDFKFFAATSGLVTSDNTVARTGTQSIKLNTSSPATAAFVTLPATATSDSGTQNFSCFRFTALPAADTNLFVLNNIVNGNVWLSKLKTTGVLTNNPLGVTAKNGSTVLVANTWYCITVSYYMTSTSNYAFKMYINGVLDTTVTNSDGTATRTGGDQWRYIWGATAGANSVINFDDIYVATGGASSASQPPVGDIHVTNKRPFANGTTNGFTTAGSGTPASPYGTGNAQYVNEQPLSTADFVSVLGAGSPITEEYNVENRQTGDVNMFGKNIVDSMGWVYAKVALGTEAAQLILHGVNHAITVTTSNAMYTAPAGSTAYAPGTGTDIGVITDTTATTFTLYEAGIMYAYKFPDFNPWHMWDF